MRRGSDLRSTSYITPIDIGRIIIPIVLLNLIILIACCNVLGQTQLNHTKTYQDIAADQKAALESLLENAPEKRLLFDEKYRNQSLQQILDAFNKTDSPGESHLGLQKLLKILNSINPPTKYQDAVSYTIIYRSLKDIVPIYQTLKITASPQLPLFASSMSHQVSADTRKFNNEWVIYINYRVMLFCYAMTKAIIEVLHIDLQNKTLGFDVSKGALLKQIEQGSTIKNRFFEQLIYFCTGKLYSNYLYSSDLPKVIILLPLTKIHLRKSIISN